MQVVDPSTGRTLRDVSEHSPADVAARLERARTAFPAWRERSFAERAAVLRAAARLLREDQERLALLMADEMGKPVAQGRAEVEKCASGLRVLRGARRARSCAGGAVASRRRAQLRRLRAARASCSPSCRGTSPSGRSSASPRPALMAGNAAVLKHALERPAAARSRSRSVLARGGLPERLFRPLLVGTDARRRADRRPARRGGHPDRQRRRRAGRSRRAAGRALKKSVLELGGSDPYVVLEDADLDLRRADRARDARLVNCGQSCIAAKRFIVVDARRADRVRRALRRRATAARADGRSARRARPDLGPLARARPARRSCTAQVEASVARGRALLLGGEVPAGPGRLLPADRAHRRAAGHAGLRRGAVRAGRGLIRAARRGRRRRASPTTRVRARRGGLHAATSRAASASRAEIEAGSCFVNALVRSDPRLPFGGVKDPATGASCPTFGIREFVNVKTLWIR